MSLVTECPNCSTTFIVKPEQLSAYQGQVRCGKCNFVFNGISHLQELSESDQPSSSEEISHAIISEESINQTIESTNEPDFKEAPSLNEPESVEPDLSNIDSDNDEHSIDTKVSEDEASPLDDQIVTLHEDTPNINLENVANFEDQTNEEILITKPDGDLLSNLPENGPTTLNELSSIVRKNNHKKSTYSTWLLSFIAFLLLLIGTFQTLYFLRSTISSEWPFVRPYFENTCKLLKCRIDLPKNANLLVIDDSDLHEDSERQNLVRFNCKLINNAPYTQAFPIIELTLTDTNDTPILRRSFKPYEYLPSNITPESGIGPGEEVVINLPLTTSDTPVSGYRVFITY